MGRPSEYPDWAWLEANNIIDEMYEVSPGLFEWGRDWVEAKDIVPIVRALVRAYQNGVEDSIRDER